MIYLPAKRDILAIQARDALLEIQGTRHYLSPGDIMLWFLNHDDLEESIDKTLVLSNPSHQMVTKFLKVRFYCRNYLLLHRYIAKCKFALKSFPDSLNLAWHDQYSYMAENELELFIGDIIGHEVFSKNIYNINIDNSYFAPIVDFLELYQSCNKQINNNF